jgi:hypothetical protein
MDDQIVTLSNPSDHRAITIRKIPKWDILIGLHYHIAITIGEQITLYYASIGILHVIEFIYHCGLFCHWDVDVDEICK